MSDTHTPKSETTGTQPMPGGARKPPTSPIEPGVDYSNPQEPTLPHTPTPPPPIVGKDGPKPPPFGASSTQDDHRHPVFTENKETNFDKPSISGVDLKTFRAGDAVLLTGTNLKGVSSVVFGGVHSSNFQVLNDGEIVATVPHGYDFGGVSLVKNVPDPEKSTPAQNGEEEVFALKPLESDLFEVKQ